MRHTVRRTRWLDTYVALPKPNNDPDRHNSPDRHAGIFLFIFQRRENYLVSISNPPPCHKDPGKRYSDSVSN
ncbi:MAG: hypothetical protein WBA74_00875, partial [Cyclobacteriaceae bacterium]